MPCPCSCHAQAKGRKLVREMDRGQIKTHKTLTISMLVTYSCVCQVEGVWVKLDSMAVILGLAVAHGYPKLHPLNIMPNPIPGLGGGE